jgi:hypothetical protein
MLLIRSRTSLKRVPGYKVLISVTYHQDIRIYANNDVGIRGLVFEAKSSLRAKQKGMGNSEMRQIAFNP